MSASGGRKLRLLDRVAATTGRRLGRGTLAWLGTESNADKVMEAGKKLVGEIEWARMRVLHPERFGNDSC
jgi:hypothetical protein